MSRQPERSRRNFGRVMKRDGGSCQYCGDRADCIDHVIPVAYHADNSMGNLAAACTPCNQVARGQVFPSMAAKREYILRKRGLPPYQPPAVKPAREQVMADHRDDTPETLDEARRDDRNRAQVRKRVTMAAATRQFKWRPPRG